MTATDASVLSRCGFLQSRFNQRLEEAATNGDSREDATRIATREYWEEQQAVDLKSSSIRVPNLWVVPMVRHQHDPNQGSARSPRVSSKTIHSLSCVCQGDDSVFARCCGLLPAIERARLTGKTPLLVDWTNSKRSTFPL